MAAPFLRRGSALLSFQLRQLQISSRFISAASSCLIEGGDVPSSGNDSLKHSVGDLLRLFPKESAPSTTVSSAAYPPSDTSCTPNVGRSTDATKEERLRDIDSVVSLAREILHSDRYENSEPLREEDEKTVVEKLLHFHPNRDEKIGSGIQAIMVDWHPHFRSRCFFVVRTDGSSIDFSYRKCLQEYIKYKFPHSSERFREVYLKKRRN